MGGKVCAIIGFGPGLGTAYADTFNQDGYSLGLLSRSGAMFKRAEATNTSVRAYKCDAGNPDNLKGALKSVESDLGPIDVVIYNADLAQFGALDDVSELQFEQSWRVGALGLFAAAKALGPQMSERGSVQSSYLVPQQRSGGTFGQQHSLPQSPPNAHWRTRSPSN